MFRVGVPPSFDRATLIVVSVGWSSSNSVCFFVG